MFQIFLSLCTHGYSLVLMTTIANLFLICILPQHVTNLFSVRTCACSKILNFFWGKQISMFCIVYYTYRNPGMNTFQISSGTGIRRVGYQDDRVSRGSGIRGRILGGRVSRGRISGGRVSKGRVSGVGYQGVWYQGSSIRGSDIRGSDIRGSGIRVGYQGIGYQGVGYQGVGYQGVGY